MSNKYIFYFFWLAAISFIVGCFLYYSKTIEQIASLSEQQQVTSLPYLLQNHAMTAHLTLLRSAVDVASSSPDQLTRNKALNDLHAAIRSLAIENKEFKEDVGTITSLLNREVALHRRIEEQAQSIENILRQYTQHLQAVFPFVTAPDQQTVLLDTLLSTASAWKFTSHKATDFFLQYKSLEEDNYQHIHTFLKSLQQKHPQNALIADTLKETANLYTQFQTLHDSMQTDISQLTYNRTEIARLLQTLRTKVHPVSERSIQTALNTLLEANATSLYLVYFFFFLALALLGFLFIIATIFVARPISWLSHALREIKHGSYSQTPPFIAAKELQELATMLHSFHSQLSQLFAHKEQIEADAAKRRELEELMQAVITASMDGYFIWDKSGILTATAGLLYMLEIGSPEQMAKERKALRLPSETVADTIFDSTVKLGMFRKQYVFSTLSGEEIPCELTHIHLQQGKDRVLTYVRDLRMQKKADNVLTNAKMHATYTEQTQNAFLSSLEQQLKASLNCTLGFSHAALAKNPPEPFEHYFQEIQHTIFELFHLLNDVLDFSHFGKTNDVLVITPFSLPQLATAVHEELHESATAKGIQFFLSLDQAIPQTLFGDQERLEEILRVLCNNSIKYTWKGHVCLKIFLVEQTAETAALAFEVQDTGQGIDKEALPALFHPLALADTKKAGRSHVPGISLFLVKNFLQLMGSSIVVESAPRIGSTFSFTLEFSLHENSSPPARQTEKPEPAHTGFSLPHESQESLAQKTVLLVEDNELNQEVAQAILEEVGVRCLTVGNGAEAVELLKELAVDLILMDLQMPVMDGLTAAREIRHNGRAEVKDIPIIALTALSSPADKENTLAAGMNGHLTKPIDIEQFRQELAKWI